MIHRSFHIPKKIMLSHIQKQVSEPLIIKPSFIELHKEEKTAVG